MLTTEVWCGPCRLTANEETEALSWGDWVSKASDWKVPCCVCLQPEGKQEAAIICVSWFWSRQVTGGRVVADKRYNLVVPREADSSLPLKKGKAIIKPGQ